MGITEETKYNYKDEDFVIEDGIIKGPSVPYIPEYSNYGALILERWRAKPNFIGQIDGVTGKKQTFAEMTEKSVKCAMWLKSQNIKPGDVVAVCTHNQPDMYIPIFASMYIGAVFNTWWDMELTSEVTRHFLTLTRPKVLFVHEASASIALETAKEVGISLKVVILGNRPDYPSLSDILVTQDSKLVSEFSCEKLQSIEDPAFIVYTSGSTGLPKGVVTSHKCLFGHSPNFVNLGEINDTIISISFSSISWGVGIACLLRAAVAPETAVIYPEFIEETTLQLIEKYKINLMHLQPRKALKLQKCPSIGKYNVSSLKLLWMSGGVVRREMQEAIVATFPQTDVFQAYGLSELGGVALRQTTGYRPGSCGKIVKNVMMKVIDSKTGKILGPNQPGEACFKSPYMMTCYLDNPKATSKAIDHEGWIHTDDLVQYDEEGHVFVTDRISIMINYRGHYISPETIEQILEAHPDLIDVAVVGVSHPTDNEQPIAFAVKRPNSDVTEEDINKLVRDRLPNYVKLGGLKFMDAIPRVPSGKVARAYLKKLSES